MRIAIAGISHEVLNFSPVKTTRHDFKVWRGDEILGVQLEHYPYGRGKSRVLSDLRQESGIELVPILLADGGTPSGMVEEAAYLEIRDEILQGLAQAGPLDGICLVLHGALLVENIWSGETDLVRSVRAVVGNDVLISARFDLHGNLTEEFANKTDIWTVYRTAPHRDSAETLERALQLLVRSVRDGLRPQPVFIRVPLLLPGEKATTAVEPMKSLLALVKEIERLPGILTAELLVGFGWADAPHASSSIAVFAEDEAHLPLARAEARRLAQAIWDRRYDFTFDQEVAPSVDEAIEWALQAPELTVFIADSGDNPTAGAPGDVPYFLSRLLAKEVPDAVVAAIPDAAATQTCLEAGLDAQVTVSLGGKLDTRHGGPLTVTGVVEHIFRPESGQPAATIVTLRTGGVRILITDIRMHVSSPDDFRKGGVEPLDHKIVVVKLGYLLPALRDIAPREILALSPGYSDMDLARLPFKFVTRPVFPLDQAFNWTPVITNVAGYGG